MNDDEKYSMGSTWRKWDLHVHTPSSLLNDYGGSSEEVWEKFILDLESLPDEFSVLGINDYIFLDGYKKVIEYKKHGRLPKIDLILPVVELRLDVFGNLGEDAWKKVNFHVIFSNEIKPEQIEQQFLNAIQHSFKLSPGYENLDFQGVITKDSLIDFGNKIKNSSNGMVNGSDISVGFNNLTYGYNEVLKALDSTYFKGKFLTAVGKTEWDALRWDGSIATKKDIINKADLVFISAENPQKFLQAKQKLIEQVVNHRLVDCSDAHNFSYSEDTQREPIKDRVGKCFTWIKADPTFDGLKQIIYEPDSRIFIGDTPQVLERVKSSKRKYINSLKIGQKSNYDQKQGVWFKGVDIKFNKELVAIIGNKGSGKSALSDIIGLLGHTHNAGPKQENLSFLNGKTPRFKTKGYAENFEAELIWEDGSGESSKVSLNENIDINQKEKVKYLPQNYFESITNDLDCSNFEKTIKSVIFLHIPEQETLGKGTFEELEDEKIKNIEADLVDLRESVRVISSEIIKYEIKKHPNYSKTLSNLIVEKEKELEEHIKNKPAKISNPSKEINSKKEIEKNEKYAQLEALNLEYSKTEKLILDKRSELNILTKEKEELTQIRTELMRIEAQILGYLQENREKFNKYELNIDNNVNFKIEYKSVKSLIDARIKKIADINEILKSKDVIEADPIYGDDLPKKQQAFSFSLIIKKENIQSEIDKIKGELSQPERDFQLYIEKLSKWEARKKEIEGGDGVPNTLKFYKAEKKYIISELPSKLASARASRISKALEIFNKKKEVVNLYNTFKQSIDELIARDEKFLDKFKVEVEANFKLDPDFPSIFLKYINKSRSGTFRGAEETAVKELFAEKNLLDESDVKLILESIINNLEHDNSPKIKDSEREVEISDQIDKTQSFYDYIFSLEYLMPIYELKLDGKVLNALSPGEKGALLLVFYLMIDKDDTPLVIDQPEDNLDNRSVFEILTHFIKNAKKRRQIIIVTHNPNLAVGADAEQIIYVSLDKINQNIFSYELGSIENPRINKRIVEVLEGTMPAFDKRKLKYFKES